MLHESFHSTESQEKTPLEYRRDETDFDVINAVELNETIESPEIAGLNLTTDQIINAGRLKEVAAAQKMIEEAGGDEDAVFQQLSEKYSTATKTVTADEVRTVFNSSINEEMMKVENFKKTLFGDEETKSELPDGVSFRVHPYAPFSPFSIENSRYTDENGKESYLFDPIAMEQIRDAYKKVNSGETPGDLSIVMNYFTSENGGNLPDTDEEIQSYADMCVSFLDQLGLDYSNGNLYLELGNETNVDRSTINSADGKPMFDRVDFADKADPKQYAKVYAAVASAIKAKHKDAKVAIAGTAMFDIKYLESVIDGVNNPDLIDKFGFHPYREFVDEGAPTFEKDPITGNTICVASTLSYKEQVECLSKLADRVHAKLDVGEVSFSHNRRASVDNVELHKNTQVSKAYGIKSYTWSGTQIIKYG